MNLVTIQNRISPISVISKRRISWLQPIPIKKLIGILSSYLHSAEIAEVERAYRIAKDAHQRQKRATGEPYIHHPLEVAMLLSELRLDAKSIVAAILHDVPEDTDISIDDVKVRFGNEVATLVDGVTKIGKMNFTSKEEAEAENFRKMLLAMSQDVRVILIKLADRLHNMRTLEALSSEKIRSISRQTLDIYAPIANRLGVYTWCRELQDLSFSHLYPKRHKAISKVVGRLRSNHNLMLAKVTNQLIEQFDQLGIDGRIIGREKSVYSIYKKMMEKHIGFKEVNDVLAVRIIVNNVDTCYRALGSIHQLYKPLVGRFKDYIAIPKENGYQSLHTTVITDQGDQFEVQIRSEAMHRNAESGVASHWMYKSEETSRKAPLSQKWLLELFEVDHQDKTPKEFLDHLKSGLVTEEVYVFTPQGKIKKLPLGATALDFAYAVHTEVGTKTVGALINQAPAPLHQPLANGDRVEILTSNTAKPFAAWLGFVVTNKARTNIGHYLKSQRRKDAIQIGRRLLQNAAKNLGVSSRRISSKQKIILLNALNMKEWEQLLFEIGVGKRLPKIVARLLLPESERESRKASLTSEMAIHGAEGMAISFGKCCYPVPGDAIVGNFTTGRGIVVHRVGCPNTESYKRHSEKWVDVYWAQQVKGTFPVYVRAETKNIPGVLANIASIIANHDANIIQVTVNEKDKVEATIHLVFEVKNLEHLEAITAQMREQSFLLDLERARR